MYRQRSHARQSRRHALTARGQDVYARDDTVSEPLSARSQMAPAPPESSPMPVASQ